MVFAKAADGGGVDDRQCNVALMRELMLKEDDALMVVKPPHKVVPPYDNDEQQEETQRRSISKRIKRAMVAFARGPSSRRQSPLCQSSSSTSPSDTTSTDASDAIMELFSTHDPRNRGKLAWDTFIDIVDTSFHLHLTSTERRLFRSHLHVPEGGTVSYVKFIAHVFDTHHHHAPSKSVSKTHVIQDNDQGPHALPPHPDLGMPSSPSHLPLLHSSSSADLTDAAAKRKQQGDLHCTKQFLQKLVKQACVEATLWHASIPQVLRRAMLNQPLDEDSTSAADDAPLFLDTSSCALDQAQFFMAMYVSLNVKVAADTDADRIFHQLVPAATSKAGPSTVTLHDLLDALVRCGLVKPPATTPAATSSTTAPSMLPRLGGGGG